MKTNNIVWFDSTTPMSIHFNDVYFNSEGAIAETRYVFIEANKLNERFLAHTQSIFTIGETGFGSGLNFIIAWQQFALFRQQNPDHPLKQLQFISIEKYPLQKTELALIHQAIFDDQQLINLAKQLEKQWPCQYCQFGNVILNVVFGDISQFADHLICFNLLVNAWFFDGFSPDKNPDMWSTDLFTKLYQRTASKGTFSTFTAAGQVRRNLINAGFNVQKFKGYGKKREMLVGYKNSSPK
ncbi:tRNA (5-methylaminomethyl-2-thiouridine)(34)-methyltransferase MnmD [Orbus wheelerorum]|uniref:tRNA (5-methylaminomethyl-2-thiouridine)(34)-methyltransferase MnmD n=1 Tax=Orbus wheelerorum TaxID=3074111 RepID=UPI00370D25BF